MKHLKESRKMDGRIEGRKKRRKVKKKKNAEKLIPFSVPKMGREDYPMSYV